MRDVTPKGNLELFLKCLGIAVGAVAIIALLKLAFSVFMSVAGWIIPIAIVLFIYKKFFDWEIIKKQEGKIWKEKIYQRNINGI